MRDYIVTEISGYSEAAKFLIDQEYSKIITFTGDLGAGKTCLVKYLCEELQCTEKASSPTFSIVNEYLYPQGRVYHFDLYRMNSIDEVFDIGIEEYLYSEEYCLIEWPEVFKEGIMENYVSVHIEVQDDNSRKVVISNH